MINVLLFSTLLYLVFIHLIFIAGIAADFISFKRKAKKSIEMRYLEESVVWEQ